MLKRCKTCRHWHGDPTNRNDEALCEAITTTSSKARLAYPDPTTSPLYTYRDFGCVLWEKREPMSQA